MKAFIDLAVVAIIVICIWGGYKKGLIMAVGGIIAILISLYGANIVANTFSGDVVSAMRPFVNGYTEKVVREEGGALEAMGWDKLNQSLEDILADQPEKRQEFFSECYQSVGIHKSSADAMAREAEAYADLNDEGAMTAVVQILCERASFVACYILSFLMILIILTVIGNIPNLSFKLPNLDMVNDICGAVLGAVTGFMFCVILVWGLKFMGIIFGHDTLEETKLASLFLKSDILYKYLGI